MAFVSVDGQNVFYARYTQASKAGAPQPTLVLIHGAGETHLHWPPKLRRLVGTMVYALDLPGHGYSIGPGRDTIDGYCAVLETVVNGWGMTQFVLAGHSMGSAIALQYALCHPEQLAGLILLGAGARLRVSQAILAGIRDAFTATTEMLIDWMIAPGFAPQKRQRFVKKLQENDPHVLYGDYVACNQFDLMAQVSSIQAPTLLICGRDDKMTPVKFSEYLHQQIQGSQLHLVEQSGHMVMLEQPEVVTEIVGQWLGVGNRE